MAKVHPNTAAPPEEPAFTAAVAAITTEKPDDEPAPPPPPTVLTVWRKSLLFNCDGFTVFDARGDLAFRVDCYGASRSRRGRAEVVLMDAAGKPLLTVRRRRNLRGLLAGQGHRHWVIYDGDAAAASTKPLPSVRRAAAAGGGGGKKKTLAHVTPLAVAPGADSEAAAYVVEGSYGRRACAVRDARGDAVVAEVRRKEAVGDDVFRLVADPRLGAPLAMGLVIALDQMFSGSKTS